jgi:hypothetical protein
VKTLNALAEPDRDPTDFEDYVRALEADPEERERLEEARRDLQEGE